MKYNLKTGNFADFEKFRENVSVPRSYFIPFSCVDSLGKTDIRNERYSSDLVQCLSGEWDFVYYKNNQTLPQEFDTDKIKFDKVTVPSMWQYTGYEEPYYVNTRYQFKPDPPRIPTDCPVGIYRRFVTIDDLSANYTISFLGVAGSLELFVNGKYVGYSEGSHNTAEFELNEFLLQGENEILVQNHKWTNGTYLECQDMFRSNGIFRDVLLYKSSDNSIYDFEVKTSYKAEKDGKIEYELKIIPSLKLTDKCELCAYLYDGENLVASYSVNQSPDSLQAIDFVDLTVCEWSAECPYLYDLILVLTKDGREVEAVRKNIGFKHIEIKGNVFYFNNQPIKLLGVDHHDTNPKTGYVMTVQDMELDVSLVKQYNANCIRTSHYPPDPTFLDLCDEYGVYVVDEADIETHGCETELHRRGVCSHNPKWREHFWDRILRMFERDKNHSCVTMWSLGNESHGYKNQDYCYAELKKRTDIPIHYEAVCRTRRWSYDVHSEMYTPQFVCEKIAAGSGLPPKYYKKPFYLCEYAHAMGVGAGELERYVQCFYSADIMLGGCIWEFVDHAVYHESGQYEYTYGGDHGEEKHDGNFCTDGLFYPDRTPHSGALQMKNCYRPVRARRISDSSYLFESHKYFENADFTVKYKYLTDGKEVTSGQFDISVAPQSKQAVDIPQIVPDKKSHNVIIFEYYDGDFMVASEQTVLGEGELNFAEPKGRITAQPSENRLFITYDNGSLIFDKKTGFIDSYIYKGRQMVNTYPLAGFKGFGVSLYRAPLDNDMNLRRVWDKFRLDAAVCNCKGSSFTVKDDKVEITSKLKVSSGCKFKLCEVKAKYTVYANGEIKADFECLSGGAVNMMLPRFGVRLEMPPQFENIKYYGLGETVNYPDFHEHALYGIYQNTVSNFRENYIKPQESATRCGVRFAEITDSDGIGFRFDALEKPFVFAANHFTPAQCARATHRDDLAYLPTTCINIDAEMLGAGSNSCGPLTSKQYRLGKLKGKTLSFTVKPIG